MDLKHFNALAIDSATDAAKFIHLLIDFLPKELNKGKAILGLYEAFSDDIKSKDAIFLPAFYKFFLNHKITEENSQYYHQFSQYLSDSEKEDIKRNNPDWSFSKTIFLNVSEFSKSLGKYHDDSFDNISKFITENKEEISRLVSLDKNSFSESMLNNKGWECLFKNNYDFFNDFCSEYNYDPIKIITPLIAQKDYSKFEKIIKGKNTDIKSIEFIIANTKQLFSEEFFTLESNNYKDAECNIVDTFLIFIMQGKTDFAYKLYNKNKKELNACLYEYVYSYGYHMNIKKANVKEAKTWEAFNEFLERINHHSQSAFSNLNFAIKSFKKVTETIASIPQILVYEAKKMEYEEMKASLVKMPEETDKKRIKI